MGYNPVTISVGALLSAHNDSRDERDEMLWGELCGKIRELADSSRYAPISPLVNG